MAAPWLVVRASQATESYLKVFGHQATGIHLQIFLDVFAQFFAFITSLFIFSFGGGGEGGRERCWNSVSCYLFC